MPKWKMIGIRVPEESDLPTRLKEISEKTRLSYCELLEKLITQAELNPSTLELGFETKDIIALRALGEKFSDLNLEFNEIRIRLQVLEETVTPVSPTQVSEATAASNTKYTQQNDRLNSDAPDDSQPHESITMAVRPERSMRSARSPNGTEVPEEIEVKSEEKAATITYIRRLSAEGLSLRKIAERLKSEEIPTLSGSGIWHYGMVRKILASAQPS